MYGHVTYCISVLADNMPVTLCYLSELGERTCNNGFPVGCYVDKQGRAKNFCYLTVSPRNGELSVVDELVFCDVNVFWRVGSLSHLRCLLPLSVSRSLLV